MSRVYTKKSEQEKRRTLRRNMTKAEVLLWLELKNKKLGARILRQYSVDAFIIDFYCPEVRLAIEVDVATHITEDEVEYDKLRQQLIKDYKIKFIRFNNMEIYENMVVVLEKIKEMIDNLKELKQTPIADDANRN